MKNVKMVILSIAVVMVVASCKMTELPANDNGLPTCNCTIGSGNRAMWAFKDTHDPNASVTTNCNRPKGK